MSEPIKNIKQQVWVFDTEYVPCPDTGRKFLGIGPDVSDEEVVGHMYAYADASEENPTPMMKSVFYKIISIAGVSRTIVREESGGPSRVDVKLWSLPKVGDEFDEKTMIQRFLSGVGSNKPQLVGFASNMFDLTLLFQRAIILGCDVREFCQRPAKPWDDSPDYFGKFNDYNIDLSQVLGGVRWLNPKLTEIALACGIPSKIGMEGSEVAKAWMDGRAREIVNYCEIDALSTYLIWLKVVTTCGLIYLEDSVAEQQSLMDYLLSLKESKPHLMEFYWQWHELNGIDPKESRYSISIGEEESTINEEIAKIEKNKQTKK